METLTVTIEQFITKHGIRFECHRVDARPDSLMGETCNDCHGQLNVMGRCQCPIPKHGTNKMRHFRCRIGIPNVRGDHEYQGTRAVGAKSFGLYFSQGSAHTEDPTLADVLDCLASDAGGYEQAKSSILEECGTGKQKEAFHVWADEYGYDTDSRKAEKTFRAIKRQSEQLKRTLGEEAYQELLWNVERL